MYWGRESTVFGSLHIILYFDTQSFQEYNYVTGRASSLTNCSNLGKDEVFYIPNFLISLHTKLAVIHFFIYWCKLNNHRLHFKSFLEI